MELGALDPQQATCSLCRENLESNSHVLFTCTFSWSIWMNMLNWWGIQGALQPNCKSFILEWDGLMRKRKWKKLWHLILGCVVWSLWFERNNSKFNLKTSDVLSFTYSLQIRISSWAQEILGYDWLTPYDLIHNLEAVIL